MRRSPLIPAPIPASIPTPSRLRQGGFATAAVLALLVFCLMAGAYMLKSSQRQSAAASDYAQSRSAAFAAQAGLKAGLAEFEGQSGTSIQMLNNYLADSAKAWLFGGIAQAGARNWVTLGTGGQSYSARILGYDPASGLLKLAADGRGPGGSESRIFGVLRMQGVQPENPFAARFVWYMAGESRNVDQAVDVDGPAYFGGDVHFNGGANGSVFRGPVKVARASGNLSSFDAGVDFMDNAYFGTPIKTQGGGLRFRKNAGFEGPLQVDVDMLMAATGQTAYFNGNINAGSGGIELAGNRLVHNGSLSMARAKHPGPVTVEPGTIDIQSRLGMRNGAEPEIGVDIGSIPASLLFAPSAFGIALGGSTNGTRLSNAYASAKAAGKLYRDFLCIQVAGGLDFSPGPSGALTGKFLFEVTGPITVNGNLPTSDPTSVCLFHVIGGGSMTGFGGSGLFRGYVHAEGTGTVLYQWSAGAEFRGAIHHAVASAGFQMNTSPGPLKLVYDPGVFDEFAPLGVMLPPGSATPTVVVKVKLVDTRIRPKLLSRYF